MSLLSQLIGTFLMFLGFIGILTGIFLYRMKQEDLGKMYMSLTMMGGGEMAETPMIRFLTRMRGSDASKNQKALQILLVSLLLAVVGAWLA